MKHLQNMILFSCALAFSAILVEGLFYFLNRGPAPPEIQVVEGSPNAERLDFFHYHPVYGYSGLPNVSKQFYGKVITHNSKGMRGPEIEYEAGDNVSRVAFIGDSQTWGWAVNDYETIPFFTNQILNNNSKKVAYEALNFGATGYGIDQSYLRFISEGLRYKPDYVVLTYFADNDIWETGAAEAWGVEKPFFFEKDDGSFCVSNIPPKRASGWPSDNLEKKFDFDSLHFNVAGIELNFTDTQVVQYFKNRSLNTSLFGSWGSDNSEPLKAINKHIGCVQNEPAPEIAHWEDKVQLAIKLIDRIRAAVEERGGKFMVVTKPLEKDFRNHSMEYNYRTVLSQLNELGIEVIDLYHVFENADASPESLYQGAGHLTPYGNQLVAKNVATRIRRY
ncbi:SGNH hydrolase-like domain-containing protein, acetyltransferase AlgX [Alteromonadaceae bacterium Bs31]|nr:SGNH hydrolase-like domain-containing protein, acetyltransferase AlgX [Alteromonadaceae bacterium Bs31]